MTTKRPYRPKDMPGLTPYITSPDPVALKDFLAKAYGFEPAGEPMTVEGKVVHLEMLNPDTRIMIGLEGAWGSQAKSPKSMNAGDQGIGLYAYVEDVESHYKRAAEAGAEVVDELSDAFWGDRMYATKDIDGNRWTFATNTADFDPSKTPK